MKRIIIACLVILELCALSGCATIIELMDSEPYDYGDGDEQEIWDEPETPDVSVTVPEDMEIFNSVKIEETVVYDENQVRITATELKEGSYSNYELNLLIENNRDQGINVNIECFSVNGIMLSGMIYEDIASGKKANSSFSVSQYELDSNRISQISEVEFLVSITDEDYSCIEEARKAAVTTNIPLEEPDFSQSVNIYSDENLKLELLGIDRDSIGGFDIEILAYNGLDVPVSVTLRTIAVNDYTVDGNYYAEISPGNRALDFLSVYSWDVKENNITSIEKIDLEIEVYELVDYNTVVDKTATIEIK